MICVVTTGVINRQVWISTPLLVSDIVAVIRQLAVEINMSPKAVIVGHDWGGAVTWSVAMTRLDLG